MHYARMFPQLARPFSAVTSEIEDGLKCLGRSMRLDSDPHNDAPDAGYTYFGQFIDHDITFDVTPLNHAHPYPNLTKNHRTPFLDLDHVYGGGPTLSPFLYRNDRTRRGRELFLIGQTAGGADDDLSRNREGLALVGDPRQDENLIIAQLHVAFLKLHNRVLNDLERRKLVSVGPAGSTFFEQARRYVIWLYQYVVCRDFLEEVIDKSIVEELLSDARHRNYPEQAPFAIPVEFSVAAFRFGHSMVRDTYEFFREGHPHVKLSDLLFQTGSGGGVVPRLEDKWIIDWKMFFETSFSFNEALPIDTRIAPGLFELHPQTLKLFNLPSPPVTPDKKGARLELPVQTLLRGARIGLPSGQDVAKACGLKPLDPDQIADGAWVRSAAVLRHHGFHLDTPLWYYILKEAEIQQPEPGRRLGKVGGFVVAKVIIGALQADPNSYLSIDPNWKPELDGQPVTKLFDLLK